MSHTDADRPPQSPTGMPKRLWMVVLRRAVKEFRDDNLSDAAAALTYYATLSVFPALLVLVSLVGLAGPGTARHLVENLGQVVPGSASAIIGQAIMNLQRTPGAGLTAVVGLLTAVWSASTPGRWLGVKTTPTKPRHHTAIVLAALPSSPRIRADCLERSRATLFVMPGPGSDDSPRPRAGDHGNPAAA